MLPRKNEHVPFSPKSQLIPRRTSPKKTPFPAVNLEHRCTVQSKSHLSTLSHLLFLFRNLVCICQAEKPAFAKSTAARIKVEHFTLRANSPNHSLGTSLEQHSRLSSKFHGLLLHTLGQLNKPLSRPSSLLWE